MKSTIERAMQSMNFEFTVDPDQFLKMNARDRKLTVDSLSEKEKFENLGMFKTLPNGKVGLNRAK